MKLSCDVIRDLLVLYDEAACSEDSRKLVEEHLEECAGCRRYLEELKLPEKLLEERTVEELSGEEELSKEEVFSQERLLKKSFHKIRQRWAASLLAVLLLLPAAGLGILSFHECTGWGMAFTNLDEILTVRSFLQKLKLGEYEQAAEMIDYAYVYQAIMEVNKIYKGPIERESFEEFYGEVLTMTEEEYVEYRRALFVEDVMTYYASKGADFSFGFSDAYRYEDGSWSIEYAIKEQYADGDSEVYYMSFTETDGKVYHNSSRETPRREDALGYVFGLAHP